MLDREERFRREALAREDMKDRERQAREDAKDRERLMALEIEQPFGDDPNDLPMEGYLLELEKEMISMLPGEVGHIRNPNRMNSPTKDHELSSVASDGSASPSPRPTAAINGRGDVVPGGNQRQQGEADAEAEARRVGEEAALMAC